jgi:hypothetical protein
MIDDNDDDDAANDENKPVWPTWAVGVLSGLRTPVLEASQVLEVHWDRYYVLRACKHQAAGVRMQAVAMFPSNGCWQPLTLKC